MKRVIFSMVVFVAMATTVFSQNGNFQNSGMKGNNLTEEQKAIIEANRAEAAANREAFKETLSEEQLAILNDATLTRDERREALWATFSEEQLAMVEANQAAAAANREAVRSAVAGSKQGAARQRRSASGQGNGKRGGRFGK